MRVDMSEKDARKIGIIGKLIEGELTNKQAARLLELSERQIMRLKAEATANGTMSILHKNRGRKPVNAIPARIAAEIINFYETNLNGYNFCHTADVLAEDKKIFVSPSTVSRVLKKHGIKSPKSKRRPKKHRSRDAREHEGEMAQMDASPFDWLVDGQILHLHGVIDDATGRVLALYLDKEETFKGYSECMFYMNATSHVPRELYTDRRTIFHFDSKTKKKLTIEEELAGITKKEPHFARALKELGVVLILATSAQGKGRVERLWETLQDRLAKDFRRKGIRDMDKANSFLRQYIGYFNRKFSVIPASPEKIYIPKIRKDRIELMFSKRETRLIDSGLSFSYYGKKYRLPIYRGKYSVNPGDPVIIATNHRIGIKAIYKGLAMDPIPLGKRVRQHSERDKPISSKKPYKPTAEHPWKKYPAVVKVKKTTGDIIADELRP